MKILDYIVVGSGPAGAIAAKTLVDAGKDVTMINVGFTPDKEKQTPKDKSFKNLRLHDDNQYRYITGNHGEGIAWGTASGDVARGAQITLPRQYMIKDVDRLMPTSSRTFFPIQSLGYGGLGIGWGLQCWEYSDQDLISMGLPNDKIKRAYDEVSKIIGISATKDDAAPYTIGELKNFQPSTKTDRNHQLILAAYRKHKKTFLKKGAYVGRTPLAILTKTLKDRKAYRYLETDFYSDADKSAWRPYLTIDELRKTPRFHYIDNRLVVSFSEKGGLIHLKTLDINTQQKVAYTCKKLILAAGAMGTARIVIRSQAGVGTKVPILSNPHSYVPAIQPTLFGKGYEDKKPNMGQVSYFVDPDGNDSNLSVMSSYGYQSLMLFRVIAQIPFNFVDARLLTRYILPGLIVAIIQHPDYPSKNKYLKLVKDSTSPTGDKLEARFSLSEKDEHHWDEREKQLTSIMRRLWTFPIKRLRTEHGSGIHYGGTLPFSDKRQKLHLAPSGKLYGTKSVFVADSSGFKYLPGKGLTFTIMANAYTVAKDILGEEDD